MTISMYQASVPRFVNILGNLSNILDKTQAHIDAKKLSDTSLTAFRLFPDMLPLSTQVQVACDTAKGVVSRLAGVDIPAFEDNETTIAELKARVAKTSRPLKLTAPKTKTSSPSAATRKPITRVCSFCWVTQSPISISTSRRPTPCCVTTAWKLASATSSENHK